MYNYLQIVFVQIHISVRTVSVTIRKTCLSFGPGSDQSQFVGEDREADRAIWTLLLDQLTTHFMREVWRLKKKIYEIDSAARLERSAVSYLKFQFTIQADHY